MISINKYTARQREFTFIELKRDKISATFMDYGATILNINTEDAKGNSESVLLAYDNLSSYIENNMFLNATVGPFSGRIDKASFKIDDNTYKLDQNVKGTSMNLHGGKETIAFKFFNYKILEEKEYDKVTFTYRKKEELSHFPGNQTFKIIYTLKDDSLLIEFKASTDKDTLVNLTNHAYFNLSGNLKSDVMDHYLQINASKTCELNDEFSPIAIKDAIGTQLDFKDTKQIKDNFFDGIYDLPEKGIDNPMLLDEVSFDIPQVRLSDPVSKRVMEVYTTYPCVVVYTHNHPDFKDLLFGVEHKNHMGICFETQFEPNGINVEGLHDSILRKGQEYHQKTLLKFFLKE